MGIWGPGNFDNDGARDHLFELTRDLAEQIDQALDEGASRKLAGQGSAEFAEVLESILPNVEIICVLHEAFGGGFLPEPESVDGWQSQFDQISDAETSAERREVIRTTFERLRQLAQQCWEE